MRAARLRASKFPKPVIWTFAPFFSSPAMIPLSSNRASIARPASALDILVRMASAAVSSALFTASPCEGLGAVKTLGIPQDSGISLPHPPPPDYPSPAPLPDAKTPSRKDCNVPRYAPRLDRSDCWRDVFREERRVSASGAAGGHRAQARPGLQVASRCPLRRALHGQHARRRHGGSRAGGFLGRGPARRAARDRSGRGRR